MKAWFDCIVSHINKSCQCAFELDTSILYAPEECFRTLDQSHLVSQRAVLAMIGKEDKYNGHLFDPRERRCH